MMPLLRVVVTASRRPHHHSDELDEVACPSGDPCTNPIAWEANTDVDRRVSHTSTLLSISWLDARSRCWLAASCC